MAAFLALREPRPAKIATIKPGVIYVDLGRITQKEFDEAVPKLAEARGIVFDLRGYPRESPPQTIGHLIDQPVTCAQWHIPVTYSPDRRNVAFSFSNWPVQPEAPRFKAKVAFLTDGRAISYAETYLGIIEHYKLAEYRGRPDGGHQRQCQPSHAAGRLSSHLDRHEGAQARWLPAPRRRHPADRAGRAHDPRYHRGPRRSARPCRRRRQPVVRVTTFLCRPQKEWPAKQAHVALIRIATLLTFWDSTHGRSSRCKTNPRRNSDGGGLVSA